MLRKIYNINGIDEMGKKLSLTLKKVMKIYYLKEKNNKLESNFLIVLPLKLN